MNNPRYHHLREQSWRRKLTGAEAAELHRLLASDPDTQAQWQTETALNAALDTLPNAPVPSNFTARVLQEVDRQNRGSARRGKANWRGWLRLLLPRAAVAAALVGLSVVSVQQYQSAAKRAELARSVAAVSDVQSLPGPDILADFEVIRRLSPATAADEELLALLQ
jgi:anti-sigma factor RsiW